MAYSIEEIANILNATIDGDSDITVNKLSPLLEAKEDEISFAFEEKYLKDIVKSKARVIIVPFIENLPAGKTYIKVKDNYQQALIDILNFFKPKIKEIESEIEDRNSISNSVKISPNCYIGHDVEIGENSFIYPNVTILEGAIIGKNCIIYPNVTIREFVEIGDNVILQPGAVIGSDGYGYTNLNGKHEKLEQIGKVIIENDVEIGANCTVDRGAIGDTIIKSGTKIDNQTHIAHNDKIGKNCLIIAHVAVAGSVEIGDNCILAGQVGVAGHIKIGDNCVIAAKSGVTNDVPDNSKMSGYPLKPHKEDLKTKIAMGHLPEIHKRLKKIEKKMEDKK